MKRDDGKRLARVFDDPDYFGFRINKDMIGSADPANRDYYLQATPAALGTLTYIAFETRRLHNAMKPKGEKFVPLEVTSLVRSMDAAGRPGRLGSPWRTAPARCSTSASIRSRRANARLCSSSSTIWATKDIWALSRKRSQRHHAHRVLAVVPGVFCGNFS